MPLQRGLRPDQTQFFFFIDTSKAKSRKRAIETICATFSFPCLLLSPVFVFCMRTTTTTWRMCCVCVGLSQGQTGKQWFCGNLMACRTVCRMGCWRCYNKAMGAPQRQRLCNSDMSSWFPTQIQTSSTMPTQRVSLATLVSYVGFLIFSFYVFF